MTALWHPGTEATLIRKSGALSRLKCGLAHSILVVALQLSRPAVYACALASAACCLTPEFMQGDVGLDGEAGALSSLQLLPFLLK